MIIYLYFQYPDPTSTQSNLISGDWLCTDANNFQDACNKCKAWVDQNNNQPYAKAINFYQNSQ